MSVEMFAQKAETIEAMEFTGGVSNGSEIMAWIRDNGFTSVWSGTVEPNARYCGMPEHIRIFFGRDASSIAYVGDYLLKDAEGRIRTCRKAAFHSRYYKVDVRPALAIVS